MSKAILKDAEDRMQKCVGVLRTELTKLRTGRANTALLDHLRVDYYGNPTPIGQVASIAVADARTLTVTPWEKNMVSVIDKAIRESDLGLNPATAGTVIRVPLPPLTEERRKEMSRVVRHEGENAKIAVRNVRRDSLHHLKEKVKSKEITEDEEKRAHDDAQKLTDKYVAEIDALVAQKERDVMEI